MAMTPPIRAAEGGNAAGGVVGGASNKCPRYRRRRRRPGASTAVAVYCYAVVVVIFRCHHHGGDDCGIIDLGLPVVKSFQYDDLHHTKLPATLYNSIVEIRGGGGESDDHSIEGAETISLDQLASLDALPSAQILCENNVRIGYKGSRSSKRGLWKRIRLLRGGVEGEAMDESVGSAEMEGEGEGYASSTKSIAGSLEPSAEISDDGDDSAHAEKEQGGIISSFFSLFRASDGDDTVEAASNGTTSDDIADKIPHGPDGRGGGSIMVAKAKPSTDDAADAREQQDENKKDGEILINTEITEVSMDSTDAGGVEFAKSLKSISASSEVGKNDLVVGTGGDSSAFVVAPPPSRKSAVKTKGNPKKRSKSSKASTDITANPEVDVDEGLQSSNSTVNTTNEELTTALNETLDVNTTDQVLESNGRATEEISDRLLMSHQKDYTSSGYWEGIDLIASLGLSSLSDNLKLSRALRPARKVAAKATGLHGFISGKDTHAATICQPASNTTLVRKSTVISIDEELGIHNTNALEAEMLARRVVTQRRRRNARRNNNRPGRRWGFGRGRQQAMIPLSADYVVVPALDPSPDALEHRRRKRVEEIDRLLQRGSARLLELQCERDDLLFAQNPLFNYTKKETDQSTNQTFGDVRTSRKFNFPPPELVNDYIAELVSSGRLVFLNHTELWQSRSDDGMDDDDESIGDDLFTPSADAKKLYENLDEMEKGINGKQKRGGGSWLLRTGFGMSGGSLGEKLGEVIEVNAYKGVCSAVMGVFAQMLAGLHGVNVLSHSDIRCYIERDPDLPPVDRNYGTLGLTKDKDYAQEAIKSAIQKGAKKKRKKHHRSSPPNEDAFIQRDAVVETLISHCQISAPLLKLFPLDWQRAIVGNILTLATSIVSDFADGLRVQILGHALTVSFKPITEVDISAFGAGGFRQNHRRTRPEEFEAAVLATAEDISESLSFLDGWLEWVERRVGGGVLRAQVGNLIARVVLTLVDEVLSGARLDLWSSQANGPRLYAALEYRTPKEGQEIIVDE